MAAPARSSSASVSSFRAVPGEGPAQHKQGSAARVGSAANAASSGGMGAASTSRLCTRPRSPRAVARMRQPHAPRTARDTASSPPRVGVHQPRERLRGAAAHKAQRGGKAARRNSCGTPIVV